MESYIQISKINDFIFCPKSLFLHTIYDNFHSSVYHETPQQVGRLNHKTIDQKTYSTSKNIYQGMTIYSSKYNLLGKIDIYDSKNKCLIERKTKIKKIYDGYKYQLYAQYFCLRDMGYLVEKLFLHSLQDNKRYEIKLPSEYEIYKFEHVLSQMQEFNLSQDKTKINKAKCDMCIYKNLCY